MSTVLLSSGGVMSVQFLPRARHENLIVQTMDDEILLFDTLTNQAHVLNQSAALVWKLSNGKRTVPELAQLIAREWTAASVMAPA